MIITRERLCSCVHPTQNQTLGNGMGCNHIPPITIDINCSHQFIFRVEHHELAQIIKQACPKQTFLIKRKSNLTLFDEYVLIVNQLSTEF